MGKKIIIIVLILAIVLIECVYIIKKDNQPLVVNNQNTEKTGWKIYSTKDWNFQISYPDKWTYLQSKGGILTPFSVLFSDVDLNNYSPAPGHSYPGKFVNVVLYKSDKTVDEYISEDFIGKNNKIKERKEITISGTSGVVTKSELPNGTYISAYISKDGYIYIFESTILNKQDLSEIEAIFNKMVSSFKFNS